MGRGRGAIFSTFFFLLKVKKGTGGRGSLHMHQGDIAST